MDSAAITDHGVMYGVIDFYRAAKAAGINPILGCEVYVAPGSRFDREIGSGEDRYYHLVLLAENNQGYQNLMKIISKGFVEGFYYKPRVDLELLREYHEGLIALSACLAGEVARYLQKNMYEEGKKAALRYQEIFGEGNFFLELQDQLYAKVRESQVMFDGDEGHHWTAEIGSPVTVDSIKSELLTGDQAQAEVWLKDKRGNKGHLEINLYLEDGAWKIHDWIDTDVYPFGSLFTWMQHVLDGNLDNNEEKESNLNNYAE